MNKMQVERLGGLAGIGLPGAGIRSVGELDLALLSAAEQLAVEALFAAADAAAESSAAAAPARPRSVRDGFRYRITRQVAGRQQSIEVHECETPAAVSRCVTDRLV